MSGLISGLVLRQPISDEFTSEAKFVAVVYADHAWEDGSHAYPAIATVATITGYSDRTVQRYLRVLEHLGILVASGKGPRGTISYSFPLNSFLDGSVRLVAIPVSETGGDSVTPRQADGGDTESGDRDSGDTGDTRINHPSSLVVVNTGDVFRAYESEIGALTVRIRDEINVLLDQDHIAPAWIVEAIHEAAEHNARNLAYIKAVLANWRTRGKGAPKPGGTHDHAKHTSRPAGKANSGRSALPFDDAAQARAERINAKRRQDQDARRQHNAAD